MASRKSEALRRAIQRAKPMFAGGSVQEQRIGLSLLSKVKPLPKGLKIARDVQSPVHSEWVRPEEGAPGDVAMLYLHGGAYCSGDLTYSRALASAIAKSTGFNTYYIEYRLAPEFPFPAPLEDALTAHFYMRDLGIPSKKIGLIGDSAGGGLALATALALREKGEETPGAVVCLSPWADLSDIGESEYVSENEDPILSAEGLRESARMYGGADLKNPLISPAYGDYDRLFPPTLLHAGTKEILLRDALKVKQRMEKQGAPVSMEIFEGMWHVWHLFNVPESEEAMKKIRVFLRSCFELERQKEGI